MIRYILARVAALAPVLLGVSLLVFGIMKLVPGDVAQVLVGTALVFGSAVGPTLSALVVEALGYRGTFALLAGFGAAATAVVICFIPETVRGGTQELEPVTSPGAAGPLRNAEPEP